MSSKYKAVKFEVTTHHDTKKNHNEPWNDQPAYDTVSMRYFIVSCETGEILDDAQGYGYKTAQNAYKSYGYKNRDKSKDKEKRIRRKQIENWMLAHHDFVEAMDKYAFEIAKGSWGRDAKFDTKFVAEMLEAADLETDFTAFELLKVWRSL